ncbi:hypothetical protein TNCV_3525211 [Trichonephila clavipes]|uniref:Uncharacterized protein n=1 Tax=Trichonephila clavipes TaxID=2585209 RepID=A0A8X6VHX7_TRICX|nr:hypothetical protein TNCV_3525211 [Trichonephila clavipes]
MEEAPHTITPSRQDIKWRTISLLKSGRFQIKRDDITPNATARRRRCNGLNNISSCSLSHLLMIIAISNVPVDRRIVDKNTHRKLKLKQKGLGGRGELTDNFIDKLQNYYGIAIRSNVNNNRMQRAHMTVIQFNKGFRGLLDVLNQTQVQVGVNTVRGFTQIDEERVNESKRHSLREEKNSRKRNRSRKKKKISQI